IVARRGLAGNARGGMVDTISVPAKYIPGPMTVWVAVPDAAAADTARRFPVVYILNGYGGDNASWLNITRRDLPALADRYGMVLVMPDGRNSWYWDSPERPDMQMESFFVKELVPYVDANLPVYTRSDKRAITGLSMGGHGALYLAMRHPDIFGNAGSMSGGVDIRPFPDSWGMKTLIGPKSQRWDDYTVAVLARNLEPGKINITFDCGIDDFFAQVNRDLHATLLEAGVPHDYTERPGRHSHAYWANSILYHLMFFNEAFAAADRKK
ncbi:MAG: esterase family protein, partial [Muribaculaceae bacterium]|nr:esterase family protein [Muribaculaceae bacterium]